MPDQLELEQVADPADKSALQQSETAKDAEKQPGATDAQEKVAETDEQKNERIQKEAAEKAEKRAKGVQKRIDELTADKHAERKRADELASQNARILALLEGKQAPAAAAQGEPKREQFESYEDYVAARAEFRAEQKAKALIEQSTKTSEEQRRKETSEQAQRTLEQGYADRQRQAAKDISDFNDVMEDADIAVPTQVYNMIMRMPDGPVIAYNMAKNPDLVQQFWSNPAEMHGILLGQLSATLKSQQKAQTKAPDPGKPVGSKAGTATEPPTDPNLYRAWADKHLK
jgi:hypothetical protein